MDQKPGAGDSGERLAAARRAFARGHVATAEQLCRELLAVTPQNGDTWTILSETALQRNRPDAAIVCAERAVALNPGDPIAHLMRARCLLQTGSTAAALRAAEQADRIDGKSSEAAEAIGAILGMLGLHGRALGLFREALVRRPDNVQLLYNLAATERMLGALEDAEAHCDQAIALDPHFYRLYHLRADLCLHTPAHNHVSEMEALLEGGGTKSWHGEVLVQYALGKECENLEQYARAFRHYKAGADLQRRHLLYDPRADLALIDAIIATHTRSVFRSTSVGVSEEQPVFIVGLPRSGTTLVERILAGHPALAAAGELGAFPLALARLAAPRADGSPGAWLTLDPDALSRAYIAEARATGILPAGRFIDKFPGNYLYCGLLHRALPEAKIVVLRRDPTDSCLAIFKTLFEGTNPFSYDLGELAAYYSAFRRLIDHWKATLPDSVLIEVAYENIVRDLPGEAHRLLDFLGLPWNERVLRFHESAAPSATASAVQIRRPLYASSVGKWRHYAAELTPLRAALACEYRGS